MYILSRVSHNVHIETSVIVRTNESKKKSIFTKEQGTVCSFFFSFPFVSLRLFYFYVHLYTYCAHMGANECSLLLAKPGIWSSWWWYESNANGPKLRFNTAWLLFNSRCVRKLMLPLVPFLWAAADDGSVIVAIIPHESVAVIIIYGVSACGEAYVV